MIRRHASYLTRQVSSDPGLLPSNTAETGQHADPSNERGERTGFRDNHKHARAYELVRLPEQSWTKCWKNQLIGHVEAG